MKSIMKKMTLKKKRAEVGMDNSKEHDLDTVAETAIPENSMKAVEYYSYGGGHEGLKIANLPIPTPQKDEVLIKMEAASINAVDCKIKQGAMKPVLPFRFPHTPGLSIEVGNRAVTVQNFLFILKSVVRGNKLSEGADVSGEVVRVGPGVTTFVPGDKVVSCTGRSGGGLAEYVIASISTTVKRPHYVSAIDGAALGVSAFAALQSVRNSANISLDGRKQEPKNLLITNGSGGVGSLAVQIAKIGGAHVTVTCGARNFEFLRSLGADEVIDYKTPEGAALKSPSGKKYDVIINCAPHQPFKLYKAQLAPTGFVIDMNPSPKGLFTSAVHVASFSKQKYYPFMHIPNSMDMYFLFNLIQTKKLTTVIDSTFPLAKSQEAWAKCMEGHTVGKIVITCAQGS